MDHLKVAAQFAAYVWYCDRRPEIAGKDEDALRFASENWVGFLPEAKSGLGEVLVKLAAHREETLKRRHKSRPFAFARACFDKPTPRN